MKTVPTAVAVSVLAFGSVCVIMVAVVVIAGKDPDKLVLFLGILVPNLAGFLGLGSRLGDIQRAVNGELTQRLDRQTTEIVRKVNANDEP